MKTMKYIPSISFAMLVVLAIFAVQATAASSMGSVTRSLSATTVAPNATVVVTITPSSNLPATNGYAIEEIIPIGFTFVSSTAFGHLVVAGKDRFFQTNNASFTYTVTVTSTAGTSTFNGTFSDSDTNTGTIAPSTIMVGPATPQPTPTVTTLSGNNGTPIPATVNNSTANISAIKKGDIKGDGKVDITDALFIAQYIAGLRTLTPTQMTAGDVDCDGKVDITDALFIAQYTAGLRTTFC